MAVTRSMTRAMNEAKNNTTVTNGKVTLWSKLECDDPWKKEFDRMDRQVARRIQITARNRAMNRWSGLQVKNGAKVPPTLR